MEHTQQEVKVGIFVIIGLSLLSLSILLIGGDQFFFKDSYQLKIQFKETQGLNKGSEVSLSGIIIGNVSHIEVNPTPSNTQISVFIEVDSTYKNLIRKDTYASIKTKGALGDKYIYLNMGSNNSPILNENDLVQSAKGNDILDVISNSGNKVEKIFEVISEINILLKSLNVNNNPQEIMENIKKATSKLDLTMAEAQKFAKILNSNSNSLDRLDSILTKLDSGQGTLGALINDSTIHKKLVKVLGGNPNTNFLKPLIHKTIKNRDQTLKRGDMK